MAKVRPEKPAKRKRRCFGCGGCGKMCDACGEPESICDCGSESFGDHDECFGTGIAFLDLEERDLPKEHLASWKKARKEEGL